MISAVDASRTLHRVQEDVLIYSINNNGLKHSDGPRLTGYFYEGSLSVSNTLKEIADCL